MSGNRIVPADIRDGLDRGEFFLEYLPTMALDDGRCLGAEALIRWRRPSGLVSPGQFIPLIENSPYAGILTYWVMDTMTSEMGDWLDANREAYLGINVPPEILGRGGMAYVASKSGLVRHAPQLMIEITERGLPDAVGIESINQRSAGGAMVALDDVTFVAAATLAILMRCNFDAIKLDKSLIDQITPQSPAPDWLRGATMLVESSKLTVIAEGVETEQQSVVLREAGLHSAQGFYYSRPLAGPAFRDFYRDHQPNRATPSEVH